jgi:hypothetical protein
MQIKDGEVMSLIESIGAHYRTNIGNRYIRGAFRVLPLDQGSWNVIESITEKSEYYSLQGYHLDELYERILALAEFVYHARREVQPKLRMMLSSYATGSIPTGNERILRDMAVNNFASNLSILADLVNKLYSRIVDLDMEAHRHGSPVYKTFKGLSEIGQYLVPK